MREYLISVVEEGTGQNAKPQTVTAAGKTATAQTGKFENGREICEGWFCGFFPSKNPKYVIIVLVEDASSGSTDSAPIFKKISEEINQSGVHYALPSHILGF